MIVSFSDIVGHEMGPWLHTEKDFIYFQWGCGLVFTIADLVHSPGPLVPLFSAAPYRWDTNHRYVTLTSSFLPRGRHLSSDDANLY
ncbi:hypothetical protein TNCV_1259001 [Trichonephila clavipes]|nr:hypothetical protein TNCV_1259001 [Trichonephila clavipes]